MDDQRRVWKRDLKKRKKAMTENVEEEEEEQEEGMGEIKRSR